MRPLERPAVGVNIDHNLGKAAPPVFQKRIHPKACQQRWYPRAVLYLVIRHLR